MSQITIDELRKAATSAHESDLSTRERDALERRLANQLRLESAEAACALFFASRMSKMIDGFPSDIDLTCPNGNLKGAFLRRRDGKWGVDYPDYRYLSIFSASENVVIEGAMKAMSIETSPAAVKAVRERVGWKLETLADDIVSAADGLHRHTVEGLFGMGYSVGSMFGLRNTEAVAIAFAKAAVPLGVNLSGSAPGTADICTRLTKTLDLPFLKAMIEVAGAKPSVAALFSAIYAGNVEGVEAILATGLSPDSVGSDGETGLHVAAHTAVNEHHSRGGIAVTKRLVELGASLDALDKDGATACDIVKGGIERIEAGDLDADPFDLDELSELKDLLHAPQRKKESRIDL